MHDLLNGLVDTLDVDNRTELGKQLIVLYNGAVANAQMDATAEPAKTARRLAQLIIDSSVSPPSFPR